MPKLSLVSLLNSVRSWACRSAGSRLATALGICACGMTLPSLGQQPMRGGVAGPNGWITDCDAPAAWIGSAVCDGPAGCDEWRWLPHGDRAIPPESPEEVDADADRRPDAPQLDEPADEGPDFSDLDADALTGDTSLASAGVGRGGFSAAPTMTGDLFGTGGSLISGLETFRVNRTWQGFILNGQPDGASEALIGFDAGSGTPLDVFTDGTGADSNNDGFVDTFDILEPIPPTEAPLPPGSGFVFQGGTAVFLQPRDFESGDQWDVDYSYSRNIGGLEEPIFLAGPDVATRRVKLAENFSPEVRDRCYMNYSYFNRALGGLGDVNRWVLGLERILVEDLVSIDFRLPMASTRSSRQDVDRLGERNYQLGNLTTIAKIVMYRNQRTILTSGMGFTAPLADDARLMRGNQTLLRIRNDSVHLLPYVAMMRRLNSDTIFQFYTQLDVDTHGNRVSGDLSGESMPVLGRLRDSTLLHLDASLHRTLLRQGRRRLVREVIGNAELHYTGSLENANTVAGNGVTVTDLAGRFDVVNATLSSHLLMGDNLVVTPGMSFPLASGTNRQFDFEAILQVNYLR